MSKSRFWCYLGMWEALVRSFVFIFLSDKCIWPRARRETLMIGTTWLTILFFLLLCPVLSPLALSLSRIRTNRTNPQTLKILNEQLHNCSSHQN